MSNFLRVKPVYDVGPAWVDVDRIVTVSQHPRGGWFIGFGTGPDAGMLVEEIPEDLQIKLNGSVWHELESDDGEVD